MNNINGNVLRKILTKFDLTREYDRLMLSKKETFSCSDESECDLDIDHMIFGDIGENYLYASEK